MINSLTSLNFFIGACYLALVTLQPALLAVSLIGLSLLLIAFVSLICSFTLQRLNCTGQSGLIVSILATASSVILLLAGFINV